MEVIWVAEQSSLTDCVGELRESKVVGIDTEFVRTRTFYPEVALYQFAAADTVFLVDPLAIDDCSELAEWLANWPCVRVMHSCSEDLEVFQHHLGVPRVTGLFDTQIAKACVSVHAAQSYQGLVRDELQREIDKSQTRSDWRRRPLTAAQEQYAAEDVIYLFDLFSLLKKRAEDLGREQWIWEDSAAYSSHLRDPADYYRSVKDGWRLDPEQTAWLKCLCTWRELSARRRDLPRNRVVPDAVLFEVARLRGVVGQARKLLAEVGESVRRELLFEVDRALAEPPWELNGEPLPRLPSPLQGSDLSRLARARDSVKALADQLGVAEAVLASRKQLEVLIRWQSERSGTSTRIDGSLPPPFGGWRKQVLLPVLEPILS